MLLTIVIGNIINDSKSACRYASDVDNRIEMALKHNKSGSNIDLVVEPLTLPFTNDVKYILFRLLNKKNNPRPILYYVSETNYTPNEYANHFRKYYQLDFDIVIKK